MHEIARILGLTDASGGWYLLWSGFFGDITIFGGVMFFLYHHQCHERRCPRLGHPVEGSPYRHCHRHHPTHPRRRRSVIGAHGG